VPLELISKMSLGASYSLCRAMADGERARSAFGRAKIVSSAGPAGLLKLNGWVSSCEASKAGWSRLCARGYAPPLDGKLDLTIQRRAIISAVVGSRSECVKMERVCQDGDG
jgi:hypothetical protein